MPRQPRRSITPPPHTNHQHLSARLPSIRSPHYSTTPTSLTLPSSTHHPLALALSCAADEQPHQPTRCRRWIGRRKCCRSCTSTTAVQSLLASSEPATQQQLHRRRCRLSSATSSGSAFGSPSTQHLRVLKLRRLATPSTRTRPPQTMTPPSSCGHGCRSADSRATIHRAAAVASTPLLHIRSQWRPTTQPLHRPPDPPHLIRPHTTSTSLDFFPPRRRTVSDTARNSTPSRLRPHQSSRRSIGSNSKLSNEHRMLRDIGGAQQSSRRRHKSAR